MVNVILGTNGPDVIDGTGGSDYILGFGGNDVIDGKGGNDIIFGGSGDDFLIGGSGNDQLYGQDGHDALDGGPGNDRLRGGNGNDVLSGGPGSDIYLGDAGDDLYIDLGPENPGDSDKFYFNGGFDIVIDFDKAGSPNGVDQAWLEGVGYRIYNDILNNNNRKVDGGDDLGNVVVTNPGPNLLVQNTATGDAAGFVGITDLQIYDGSGAPIEADIIWA